MELAQLRRHLQDLSLPADEPLAEETVAGWIERVESVIGADAAPQVRALLQALDDLSAVWEEPWTSDVRRDTLIRWDRATATWIGTEPSTGAPWMVRVLRPGAVRRPVLQRAFQREAEALRRVLPVVVTADSIGLRAQGWPVARLGGPGLARALLSALAELDVWAGQGLCPVAPSEDELRTDASGRVSLAVLTLGDAPGSVVSALFERIDPDDEGALADAVRTPPASLDEARTRVVRALAAELAARRHALVQRWRAGRHAWRRTGLRELVERLQVALPPPQGQGAVGVDLDGRITVLRGEPGRVTFGPAQAPEVVWDRAEGFRPPLVRRMLRARAMSPPNPVLDARIGGHAAVTDALCRWVAEGARLRTLQLLLAVEG